TLHQLAKDLLDRDSAGQRMGVPTVGAETEVAGFHGGGKAGGDGFLTEGQVACAFDQVLQEQVVCALLRLADGDLRLVETQPHLFADVVVYAVVACGRCPPPGRFPRPYFNPVPTWPRSIRITHR